MSRDDAYSVEELSLQRRKMVSLGDSLSRFKCVKTLDLSRNMLTSVSGVVSSEYMRSSVATLSLYYNKIRDPREITSLSQLSKLTKLDLRLNPITRSKVYRLFVLASLPQLTRLDERDVGEFERRRAQRANISVEAFWGEQDEDEEENEESNSSSREDATKTSIRALIANANESDTSPPHRLDANPESAEIPAFFPTPIADIADSSSSARESKKSATGGVRWRAEVAGYAPENLDESVDAGSASGGSIEETLRRFAEFISATTCPPDNETWALRKAALMKHLDDLSSFYKQEVRDRKNEILRLRSHYERQMEQQGVRMQNSVNVDPRAEQAEERVGFLSDENEVLRKRIADLEAELNTKMASANKSANAAHNDSSSSKNIMNNNTMDADALEMLREAHGALINANRGLLKELSDAKDRHQQDTHVWERNFNDLLQQAQSRQMDAV